MAERQETSVMVSIQEILRDAQHREEQEKIETQQRAREDEQKRLEELRRKQEAEQERLRAEESDRQRRAFEEQKRQAEIQALQEAAIQRAKMEAEAQARLAEMASRQEHERQLHALTHDRSKRRLQLFLAGLGVLVFALAIGGGYVIKQSNDKANAAEAHARALEAEKQDVEAQQRRLQFELESTKDPGKIAELQARLTEQTQKLETISTQITQTKKPGPAAAGGGGGGAGNKATGGNKPPCNCTPGDPLCSCL